MNLKKKTLLAITVKFVLCITVVKAQNVSDSAKRQPVVFYPYPGNSSIVKKQALPNRLPGNFYATQLPFFCSKELKVQKAVGIPVKFRLSTVEYCDQLEGKNR